MQKPRERDEVVSREEGHGLKAKAEMLLCPDDTAGELRSILKPQFRRSLRGRVCLPLINKESIKGLPVNSVNF